MIRYDRLTTLMSRFQLSVTSVHPDVANLIICGDDIGVPEVLKFGASVQCPTADMRILLALSVDWGGAANPLLAALPETTTFDITHDLELRTLVNLMQSESTTNRCGAASILSRLGEVLVVRLLRLQIESGTTKVGLLAGLADARVSRAIVALHDTPGRDWQMDDLAEIAALSRSRFAERFQVLVGEPPMAYLRRWRLTLARQDLGQGHRVDSVARRYGYASPESFTRAFRKLHGLAPSAIRP